MAFDAHGSVSGKPSEQPVSASGTLDQAPVKETPTPEPKIEATESKDFKPEPAVGSPEAEAAAKLAANDYSPNFKYKVRDQEYEFDEFLRGAIKDAETEKKIRELYEKARGLDIVKPKFDETRSQFESTKQNLNAVMADIQEAREFVKARDFDSFFQKLRIPEDMVLQWVVEKAKMMQAPAEQRELWERQRKTAQEASEYRKRAEMVESQYAQTQVEVKKQLLGVEIAKPDVSEFQQKFDSRPGGKPGDFLREVVKRGELAWYSEQKDLTPAEAIGEVMSIFGAFMQSPAATAPAQQSSAAAAPAPEAPARKVAVIPSVAGKSATTQPVKKAPRSIEELKKLASQMSG